MHADHAQVLQSTRSKYYGEISGLSVKLLIDIPSSAATTLTPNIVSIHKQHKHANPTFLFIFFSLQRNHFGSPGMRHAFVWLVHIKTNM